MKVSTTAQWFYFPPFVDLRCDTGIACGLDVSCCHKAKDLEFMTMSWIGSRVPCAYWTLVHIQWQPQQQGWYIALAWAMQRDPCIPHPQIISNLNNSTIHFITECTVIYYLFGGNNG